MNFQIPPPSNTQNLNLSGSVTEKLMKILKDFGPETRARVKPVFDPKICDSDFAQMIQKQIRENQRYPAVPRREKSFGAHSQEMPHFDKQVPRPHHDVGFQQRQQFNRSKFRNYASMWVYLGPIDHNFQNYNQQHNQFGDKQRSYKRKHDRMDNFNQGIQ
jgi:hypothetical protein